MSSSSSLSLIPYSSSESRQVILRHNNAIVIRDPSSQRLDIQILTECPTCHQPLRPSQPTQNTQSAPPGYPFQGHTEQYVDPNYFRMLRAARHHTSEQPVHTTESESSGERLLGQASSGLDAHEDGDGGRIRSEAFSPNYFATFFVEERLLGKGGKGVVLLVRHEIDGCNLGHFACKRVPVGDNHAWLTKALTEVSLLAKLSHPNLVSYRHVWLENKRLSRWGPEVPCAFILQQYCNGGDLLAHVIGDIPKAPSKEELKARMRRRSRGHSDPPSPRTYLPLSEIYSLFRDVTAGLVYLHGNGYIHRDLKPSNCLLHHEQNVTRCLISDFGEVQVENAARVSSGSTGTISYCAPEVLMQDSQGRYGNFTAKSDIFSLGMILYFLCFKKLPYISANIIEEEKEDLDLLRQEILLWNGFTQDIRERPDLPKELYQLISTLLSKDPLQRPSASEVLTTIQDAASLPSTPTGSTLRMNRSSSPVKQSPLPKVGSPNPFASTPSNPFTRPATLPPVSTESVPPETPSTPSSPIPLLLPPPPPSRGLTTSPSIVGGPVGNRLVGTFGVAPITALRGVVFLWKLGTLLYRCAPYAPRTGVAIFLVSVAGGGLLVPLSGRWSWGIGLEVSLAVLHEAVLLGSGNVCMATAGHDWTHHN